MWLVRVPQSYRGTSLILAVNVYWRFAVIDGASYFEIFDGKTKFAYL